MIGPFTPLMPAPGGSHATLMGGNRSDAMTLMVLAVASIALAFTRHQGALWLTGLGALVLIGSSYINLKLRLTPVGARDDGTVAEALAGGAFLSWGWAVLFAGTALLLIAAALRERFALAAPPPAAVDDLSDVDLGALGSGLGALGGDWSVHVAQATGETRNALRGILWEMDRNRSEAEIQRLLNSADIIVAKRLTAEQANQLMTRLHDAGLMARKTRAEPDVAGLTGGRK